MSHAKEYIKSADPNVDWCIAHVLNKHLALKRKYICVHQGSTRGQCDTLI